MHRTKTAQLNKAASVCEKKRGWIAFESEGIKSIFQKLVEKFLSNVLHSDDAPRAEEQNVKIKQTNHRRTFANMFSKY